MNLNDYKLETKSGHSLSLLNENINTDLQEKATITCFELIEKYRKITENEVNEAYEAINSIKDFIFQNNKYINPSVFITTDFISHILNFFLSQSIVIDKKISTSIIELLTNHQIICEHLINTGNIDIMSNIAYFIEKEPNVYISEQYINIMIHLLPSFYKFDHIESELLFDHISQSSAHLAVIKFICHVISIYKSSELAEVYINIIYDKLELYSEISMIDEDVLYFVFVIFTNLSTYDITSNIYILDKIKGSDMPIFEYIMKYFDQDIHINSRKAMIPLFTYILSIFKNCSTEKKFYERYVFQYITDSFNFFMFFLQNSQDSFIRNKALECIEEAIHLESLKELPEIKDFLLDRDLFAFFVDILKDSSIIERHLAFQIIIKKMEKINKISIEYIYGLDFLEDIRDMICIEPEKSILFFYVVLYLMDEVDRGKEAAYCIKELNVFDEVNHFIESNLTSKLENEEEKLFEITEMLKKLMDRILGEEES